MLYFPEIESLEGAVEYLGSEGFTYPGEIGFFDSVEVLPLFRLSKTASSYFSLVEKGVQKASWRHAGAAVFDSIAKNAVSTLVSASRGNASGSLKSFFSMNKNLANSPLDSDRSLANESYVFELYLRFDRLYSMRVMASFGYIKENFPHRRARTGEKFVRDKDQNKYFMVKL